MSLHSQLGKLRASALTALYRRPVGLGSLGPIVTFTFDDFPRSAFTVGGKILESYEAKATYYVAAGLMDTDSSVGRQFSRDDLASLVERGHEVAIHGFDHLSARRTRVDEFIADVRRCENALHSYVSSGVTANFAYPYGEATLSAKRRLGPLMSSSRGTVPGLNGPELDLNLLRSNFLYGDVDQLDRAKRLLEKNTERKSWLIFYSHDVAERPSQYGCTPELLRQTVRCAADHGAKILAVTDVVQALCPAA
ncbi:MAG TPA: polysaccharide deacetylase family protein [Terracidiphilus sp.]|nr:polysaccharide deacetylase family protein [Terracidiphilus sp.]